MSSIKLGLSVHLKKDISAKFGLEGDTEESLCSDMFQLQIEFRYTCTDILCRLLHEDDHTANYRTLVYKHAVIQYVTTQRKCVCGLLTVAQPYQ